MSTQRESFLAKKVGRFRAIAVALGLVCVFLVLLDVFGLSLFHGSPNVGVFGDVATWFGGLATFGAVVVALYEVLSQRREAEEQLASLRTSVHHNLEVVDGMWMFYVHNLTGDPVQIWEASSAKHTDFHLCHRCVGRLNWGTTPYDLHNLSRLPQATANSLAAFDISLVFIASDGGTWVRDSNDSLNEWQDRAPTTIGCTLTAGMIGDE